MITSRNDCRRFTRARKLVLLSTQVALEHRQQFALLAASVNAGRPGRNYLLTALSSQFRVDHDQGVGYGVA